MWIGDSCFPCVSPWWVRRLGSSSDQNRSCGSSSDQNASPRAVIQTGSSSDQNRSCGGGPGTRRQWPRMDADLDQDRSEGANRSCGGSRAESPASSAGSVHTRAPGDSEESTDEGYDSERRKERARRRSSRRVTVAPVVGEPTYIGHRSTQHNNRFDVGNAGAFFGIWGQRTQSMNGRVQNNIDAHILEKPMPSHWLG